MDKKWLSITQFADDYNLKVRTIREWIRLGKLKAYKVGRYWRIDIDDALKFVEEREKR